jgi:hypothetical protein
MTLIRCRSSQIPCYHYIITLNSDTYPYCSNKIVVIVGLCNQGLRICNTQTTHLPINIMTNYKAFSFIVVRRCSNHGYCLSPWCTSIRQSYCRTMQDTCMAPGCTSDPHGLVRRQWLCNQLSTRRDAGRSNPHSVLPPAEIGTAQFRSSHGRLRCCT